MSSETVAMDMLSGRTRLGQHLGTRQMSTPTQVTSDEQQILGHIHGIFRAYLDEDREAIRRTHTQDWAGFQVSSREMVRGIESYMRNANATLDATTPLGYELLEHRYLRLRRHRHRSLPGVLHLHGPCG